MPGADAWLDARLATLEAAAEIAGAQSAEALPDRIRALQDELREARRRLKAGGGAGLPKPGELVAASQEVAPGVSLVSFAGPYESIDALKAAAKDVRGVFDSGVIALGLDADEPQIFVTVSDDLVGRGIRRATSSARPSAPSTAGVAAARRWPRARARAARGCRTALAAIASAVRARAEAKA